MATTRTITNAWKNRYPPDVFYEQMVLAREPVVRESALDRIKHLLMYRYGGLADVFISGAFYICYDKSDGNRRLQPDCIIVFDVDAEAIRYNLPNYWIWEVGKSPDFVIEIASPSTASNDLGRKRDLYAELGITEYWRFDPTGGELYGQPLAGERLVDGEYQPYELRVDGDGSAKRYSELLDLDFYWDGEGFDVLDPETGKTIDMLETEREARQADRLAFEAREREHQVRERELLDEINRLRRKLDD